MFVVTIPPCQKKKELWPLMAVSLASLRFLDQGQAGVSFLELISPKLLTS